MTQPTSRLSALIKGAIKPKGSAEWLAYRLLANRAVPRQDVLRMPLFERDQALLMWADQTPDIPMSQRQRRLMGDITTDASWNAQKYDFQPLFSKLVKDRKWVACESFLYGQFSALPTTQCVSVLRQAWDQQMPYGAYDMLMSLANYCLSQANDWAQNTTPLRGSAPKYAPPIIENEVNQNLAIVQWCLSQPDMPELMADPRLHAAAVKLNAQLDVYFKEASDQYQYSIQEFSHMDWLSATVRRSALDQIASKTPATAAPARPPM